MLLGTLLFVLPQQAFHDMIFHTANATKCSPDKATHAGAKGSETSCVGRQSRA